MHCSQPNSKSKASEFRKDNDLPKKCKAPINRFAVLELHGAVDSPTDRENTTSDMPSVSSDYASGLNAVTVRMLNSFSANISSDRLGVIFIFNCAHWNRYLISCHINNIMDGVFDRRWSRADGLFLMMFNFYSYVAFATTDTQQIRVCFSCRVVRTLGTICRSRLASSSCESLGK
jgi:hypothetical protein